MIKGETKFGFAYEVDEKTMDNMELVDALAEVEDDNPIAASKVVKLVLGETQRRKLYDHLRTEDGRVPVSEVLGTVEEIFNSMGRQGKNS